MGNGWWRYSVGLLACIQGQFWLLSFERIATSDNDWTDDEIGFQWFKQSFIPQANTQRAAGRHPDKGNLLIYNGHHSHVSDVQWVGLAMENNTILFCLPSHTTHCLQPLDVGCFGPLQTAWFNRCNEILDTTGEGMHLRDVVKEYWECQKWSFKDTTILQAWKKSGIHPFNPGIFTAADYTPSIPSSTKTHLPASFPRCLPRAPDASSDDAVFDPEILLREQEWGQDDGKRESGSDSEDSNLDFCSKSEDTDSKMSNPLSRPSVTWLQQSPSGPGPAMSSWKTHSQTDTCSLSISAHSSHSSCPSASTSSTPLTSTCLKLKHEQLQWDYALLQLPCECLQEDNSRLAEQRDASDAHAILMGQECSIYKYRLNEKTKKKDASKRQMTSAWVMMLTGVRQELADAAAQKAEEKRVEEAKKKQGRWSAACTHDLLSWTGAVEFRVFRVNEVDEQTWARWHCFCIESITWWSIEGGTSYPLERSFRCKCRA